MVAPQIRNANIEIRNKFEIRSSKLKLNTTRLRRGWLCSLLQAASPASRQKMPRPRAVDACVARRPLWQRETPRRKAVASSPASGYHLAHSVTTRSKSVASTGAVFIETSRSMRHSPRARERTFRCARTRTRRCRCAQSQSVVTAKTLAGIKFRPPWQLCVETRGFHGMVKNGRLAVTPDELPGGVAHLHRNLHRINPLPDSKLRVLLCNRVHQTMTIAFSQPGLPRFEPCRFHQAGVEEGEPVDGHEHDPTWGNTPLPSPRFRQRRGPGGSRKTSFLPTTAPTLYQ
jgi:hypothetical protein